jgi:predicted alpha/beta hydrolase family esterase
MQVLILHGWQGSGADHWQTWLAERLRARGIDVRYPALPDPGDPDPAAWDEALQAELDAMVAPEERVVVCHSLACALWLRLAARRPGVAAARVLLVAPPTPESQFPEVARFFPTGADAEALAAVAGDTRLTCADNDPYCPEGAAALYGEPLRIPVDLVPGGGHLNPDAGFGPWPEVEAWVAGEAPTVRPAGQVLPPRRKTQPT